MKKMMQSERNSVGNGSHVRALSCPNLTTRLSFARQDNYWDVNKQKLSDCYICIN